MASAFTGITIDDGSYQSDIYFAPTQFRVRDMDLFLEIWRCHETRVWRFWMFIHGTKTDAKNFYYKLAVSFCDGTAMD